MDPGEALSGRPESTSSVPTRADAAATPAAPCLFAPAIGWCVMLIGIYLATSSVLSIPFLIWRMATVKGLVVPLGGIAVVSAAAFGLTSWVAVLLSRCHWRDLAASLSVSRWLAFAGLLMALGMLVVCSEIHNWTLHLIPMPGWLAKIFADQFNIKAGPVGAFIALAMIAPIVEEFLCRRWLLESLLRRMSPAFAVPISALVFGLMHLNPWQFFYATALGLGIGWLYWRSRSVGLCILWHATNNALVFVLHYWSPNIEGFGVPSPGQIEFQPLWLTGAGCLLLLGGALLVRQHPRPVVATCVLPRTPAPPPPPLPCAPRE